MSILYRGLTLLGETPEKIIDYVDNPQGECRQALMRVRKQVPFYKRQIDPCQGAVLYRLVRTNFDRPDVKILEIGTAWGYSAACMAEAAPSAQITTLNPKLSEREIATRYLKSYPNVTVRPELSWDWIRRTEDFYDVIFVDGDHGQVQRDFDWWSRLEVGGLILFHDYSPADSGRPCQEVYTALNDMRDHIVKRDFDVLVTDHRGIGMAGWFRHPDSGKLL